MSAETLPAPVDAHPTTTSETTRVASGDDEPGALAAVGALLLIGGLVFSLFWAVGHDPTIAGRFAVRQAASLLAAGQYSEAASAYERTLPTYDSPAVRLGLSYAYLARRDAVRAERQARAALSSAAPDLKPASWAQLGRVLAFEGKSPEAAQAFAQTIASAAVAVDGSPSSADARSARWHLAMLKWQAGAFDEARAQLEQLQSGDDIYAISARVKLAQLLAPENSDISRELAAQGASMLVGAGQNDSAGDGAATPDLNVPGLGEGLSPTTARSITDSLENTSSQAEQARAKGVDQAGIDALWGSAFLQQGDARLAQLYLRRAVAANPALSDAHSYLALALQQLGDIDGALGEAQKASSLDPQRPLPRYILAQLYIQKQAWDDASAQLSTLKRLEPNSIQMHTQLANYYTARGEYQAAEDEYKAALDQERAGQVAQGLDPALNLARFYTDVRGEGCEKGLPAAQESLSRHPGDPTSLDAVGWALVQCKMGTEAASSLEKAAAAVPGSPRFHYHLAKAYALLGRNDDAREQFARAIDLDPGGDWERLAISDMADLGASYRP